MHCLHLLVKIGGTNLTDMIVKKLGLCLLYEMLCLQLAAAEQKGKQVRKFAAGIEEIRN